MHYALHMKSVDMCSYRQLATVRGGDEQVRLWGR